LPDPGRHRPAFARSLPIQASDNIVIEVSNTPLASHFQLSALHALSVFCL
jgi:hypothetical protein